jgi:hypothetical protein
MEKPKVQEYKTKCVMLGRKPAAPGAEYKTAIIALFNKNNPHKTGEVATKVLEFDDMEKVRLRNLSVSYYLEGNDIIINDLKKVVLEIYKNKIVLKAYQEQVEHRK